MKMRQWILLALIIGVIGSGIVAVWTKTASSTTTSSAANIETAGSAASAGQNGGNTSIDRGNTAEQTTGAVMENSSQDPAQATGTKDVPAADPAPGKSSPAQANAKVITPDQLKAANGKNGAPAYIAYHGKVYDLAGESVFVNGVHIFDPNIKAGMDLTDLFDKTAPSSHRAGKYISKLKEIGILGTETGMGGTNTGTGASSSGTTANSTGTGTGSTSAVTNNTSSGTTTPAPKPSTTTPKPSAPAPKPSTPTTGVRTFTDAQLKAANGQNGAPAYIAYHGKVYDLAGDPAFVNGVHKYDRNIKAGMDLTNLFDTQAPSSHQAGNYISRLTQVGVMGTAAGSSATSSASNPPASTPKPTAPTPNPSTSAAETRTFTEVQLKAANGQNGAPAYIAYHGKVYDLAGDPAFVNGVHKYDRNIKAGMDLTNLFDNQAPSSHQANNYISRLTQVGVMDASYAGPAPVTTTRRSGSDDNSEEEDD